MKLLIVPFLTLPLLFACSKGDQLGSKGKGKQQNATSEVTGEGEGDSEGDSGSVSAQDGDAGVNDSGIDATGSELPSPFETVALTCGSQATVYTGFGNRKLSVTRVSDEDMPRYGDRFRIKPYEVLSAEYMRATGVVPTALPAARATFAAPPARWYKVPQHSSITIFTIYNLSYEAALRMAEGDASYKLAPNAANTQPVCESFAEKAWRFKPSMAQIESCMRVALEETKDLSRAEARWAHALASVLTASNFLAY